MSEPAKVDFDIERAQRLKSKAMSIPNSCDNGPPWCEQYRRLTAEVHEWKGSAQSHEVTILELQAENAKLLAAAHELEKERNCLAVLTEEQNSLLATLRGINERLMATNGDLANIIGKLEAEKMGYLRDTNTLVVIRNLLGVDNNVPVEDAVNRLIAERNRLRAALEEIARLDSPPLGRYGIIAREALKSE